LSRQSAREVALFTRELRRATRDEKAGRAVIERVRRQRLQRVLEAASRTPLYAGQLDAVAVREGRLDAVEPVTKATFLDRLDETFPAGDLTRARLDAWVRDKSRAGGLLDDRYVVAMTSGTTGTMGLFVNDVESWALMRGLTFARIFRGRLGAFDMLRAVRRGRFKMSFIVASGGHFMTYLLAHRVPRAGAVLLDSRVLSIEMPVPAIVKMLNEQKPHLLHSYPTLLELLAHEKRAGRLRIDPEVITAGSETLTQPCRQAIREAFEHAHLVETYAATECVPLATACSHGQLHVNEDACILEPITAAGEPAPDDGLADRVLVTNLLNTAQPLLRYELTDQLQLVAGACPCGSPLRRVRVAGRTDDTFFLKDPHGQWQAHPPIPLEVVFLQVPGLLQYQLVHERQNELKVLFVAEPGSLGRHVAGALDAQLSRYLADHGLTRCVAYTLEEVDRIERHAQSRKIRQITSRVPRPEAQARSGLALRERRRRPRADGE
jgi:phenylacetate-coenzyme A ligase PaaK-like adenylate-forming protein